MNYIEKYLQEADNMKLPEVIKESEVSWKSPSNIALIKYWGKKEGQIPSNPSMSFTLDKSYTETRMTYRSATGGEEGKAEFIFEGVKNESFGKRIDNYFSQIKNYLPFLGGLSIKIESSNSFPHSAGIASSASSMSSLALCLCSIEKEIFGTPATDGDFYRKASFLARLGSGSASRSVYGGYSVWGETQLVTGSSDEFAMPYRQEINDTFMGLNDSILIVSSAKKAVSSSTGHALMKGHPFASARFRQAVNNLGSLINIMKGPDFSRFAEIVENEALTLHSMMMTSTPGFILIKEGTLKIIAAITDFRLKTGLPVTFTLDAGPNVHLIYPVKVKNEIWDFVNDELAAFCEDGRVIHDNMGQGPEHLS